MSIKRYDEIMRSALSNMIARQDKITDFNEGSIIHTFLDTVSRIAERQYVAIRQGYNEQLAILPYSPFGMKKKEGRLSSGAVVFSREQALGARSLIPKGTVVSGDGLEFKTARAGSIDAGEIDSEEIEVTAVLVGKQGNVPALSVAEIVSILPIDIVSVKNTKPFTGGTDEETDAEFEDRFKFYINGLSGTNPSAVKFAALSVNEVRSVSIQNHKPPYRDIYNMSIYVDDGSGGASEDTIEKVKLAIEGDGSDDNPGHVAPGINIRVITPTAIPVNISAKIKISKPDRDEAKNTISELISTHVNGLTIGKHVVIAGIIKKIMGLSFVQDVSFTSPTENIEPGINQIARLGFLDLDLEEVEV